MAAYTGNCFLRTGTKRSMSGYTSSTACIHGLDAYVQPQPRACCGPTLTCCFMYAPGGHTGMPQSHETQYPQALIGLHASRETVRKGFTEALHQCTATKGGQFTRDCWTDSAYWHRVVGNCHAEARQTWDGLRRVMDHLIPKYVFRVTLQKSDIHIACTRSQWGSAVNQIIQVPCAQTRPCMTAKRYTQNSPKAEI